MHLYYFVSRFFTYADNISLWTLWYPAREITDWKYELSHHPDVVVFQIISQLFTHMKCSTPSEEHYEP